MLRTLIIDDHAVVREGLKQILMDEFQTVSFGEARDGAEALTLVQQQQWDIAILDISLPGRSGLDILKDLKAINSKLPFLVHSMHPEDQFAVRALKLGAAGYLSKADLPEELVKAIRKIISGGKYVSAALAERLAFDVSSGMNTPPHELLSEREYQVMQMIAAGKSTSAIAEELSLSAKTISTYRARLLEKMNMKTNADIIYYVINNKLNQQ